MYGFDYEETFAPTLRMESLRMLFSLAIRFGLHVEQMDVPNAYLRGSLDEEVYMEIPQGLDLPHDTPKGMVLRLLKGLYGLKQSGRIWNKKIRTFLISIGFSQLTADNCVFINHPTNVIISLYVDDLLIFSKTMGPINSVKKQLHKEYNMKDLGPVEQILGIRVRREDDRLALDQTQYIENFLKEYQMDEARTVQTPIDGYEALTPARPEEERANQLAYQKRIGSVMYAMIGTRPDIAFAVGKLSQFSHDPTTRHMNALNRVLRNLKGTADLALIYESDTAFSTPICYADAAYGDDKVDRKSTYGTTMMMGNGAVMWTSKKQRTTSTSTTEAEYVALCHASKDIVWATRWIKELRFKDVLTEPMVLAGDNKGSHDLIKNPEHHSRTKHIDVQYHYIREVVEDGTATIKYVPTKEMVADIFTKPLTLATFNDMRGRLGLREW